MGETPSWLRVILGWPAMTFSLLGAVIGKKSDNAADCKKNGVTHPYLSFYAYLYTRTGIWQSIC